MPKITISYGLASRFLVPLIILLNLAVQANSASINPIFLQASAVSNTLCSIYFLASTILFLLALMLMILGGAIYAGATLLPGSARGGLQAYAWGLILGGTAGAIIGMIAPWILATVTGNTVGQILNVCSS